MPEYPPPYTPWSVPPRRTRVADYPVNVIEEYAIGWLTLAVPNTVWNPTGPKARLELLELRDFVINRATDQEKDLVWRHIGERARAEGRWWNLFAVGMATPMLEKLAKKITAGLSYDRTCYKHFRLIEEFLSALHRPRIRLTRSYVFSRVIGAAYDQATGRKATRRVLVDVGVVSEAELQAALQRDRGWPSDPTVDERAAIRELLDRLVDRTRTDPDGYRITEEHVRLVLRTRIDREPLKAVAAELDLSVSNASKQRARAEMLIAGQLHRPDLAALAQPRRRQRASRGRSGG